MADRETSVTIVALPKSEALIAHAAAAIHAVSIIKQKLVPMRGAAVAGFDAIIDERRIETSILLQLHARYDFSSRVKIHVGFSPDEMRLLHECRKRLQPLTDKRLDRVQTIILALMRMARPEFPQIPQIDVRALPTIDSRLRE